MQFETPARPAARTPSRRQLVTVAAVGTVGVGALAACGGGDEEPAGGAAPDTSTGGGESSGGAAAGGSIVALADVPVGGAVSAESGGTKLIVAQPSEGEVVAFDARCPHQGCSVAPKDSKLVCPCHESTFEAATGERISGPATTGLTEVPVKVEGTDVVAG